MYALSATDAISAIQRTKTFLFRPFKWGTFLKLSLVAVITEGSGGNFKYSNSGGHSSSHSSSFYSPFNLTPGWIAAIVAVSLLTIVLSFILYYLITRLRFAYFHCLIHNTNEIGPAGRLYRPQAAALLLAECVVGFFLCCCFCLAALPLWAASWRLFRQLPPAPTRSWFVAVAHFAFDSDHPFLCLDGLCNLEVILRDGCCRITGGWRMQPPARRGKGCGTHQGGERASSSFTRCSARCYRSPQRLG